MSTTEKLYIKTTPSQIVNVGHFFAASILAVFMVGGMLAMPEYSIPFFAALIVFVAPYVLWRYLVIASTVYEITSERIKHRYGVLNKTANELELYRVRDYQLQQPSFLTFPNLFNP